MKTSFSRRSFIRASSALAGFHILPSGLLANSPNGRLCTAHIGIGGKGLTDTRNIAMNPRTEVVALCDTNRAALPGKKRKKQGDGFSFPQVEFFQDYREMFDKWGDRIDAVSVSTPDHTHFPATLAALERGMHTYTQKPLTNNILEARKLREVARKQKVVTQMGIQNQSSLSYRMATHFVRSGLLGRIRQVHVWSFKDWGYDGAPYTGEDPVPDTLDWNLWLGTAPERPYLKGKYHPGNWRRIMDFGCGTLGDMGVHIFDTPFRSLKLKPPVWAETQCRTPNQFSLPTKSTVRYGFEPTEFTTQDFGWTWYDGAYAPPVDVPGLEMPEGEKLPNQGAMFIGEEGRMLLGHVAGPRFFPKAIPATLVKPDLVKHVDHYTQWIDAILGDSAVPTANFDYASSMVEAVLLGVVAGQFPGRKLSWDSAKLQVTNVPEANKVLRRDYRDF